MRDYEGLVKRLREEAREADTFKLMEDLFEAADAIEELSKPKWISVEERLPEVGKCVLTISKFGHCFDRTLREHNGGVLLFAPDGLAPGKDVTHWMPLPEPPKEAPHEL